MCSIHCDVFGNVYLSSAFCDWRKYEEINAPSIEGFCDMTANTYTKAEVCPTLATIHD